jgi:hypothetical protein
MARERPILFSGAMVRAILEGWKTQTRRVVRFTPAGHVKEPGGHRRWHPEDPDAVLACPYGQPGDRLWVRERFTYWERRESDAVLEPGESRDHQHPGFHKLCERLTHDGEDYVQYLADGALRTLSEWPARHDVYDHCVGRFGRVIPSIHMPRWASRLTMEITGVRAERVQDITDAGAEAEGAQNGNVAVFAALWDSINDSRGTGWDRNPWVWVVEFKVLEPATAGADRE